MNQNLSAEFSSFDEATILQAKSIAPGWDIKALAQTYFDWTAEKAPTKNIRAHFINFCRAHMRSIR
jgi:hypothetical protein